MTPLLSHLNFYLFIQNLSRKTLFVSAQKYFTISHQFIENDPSKPFYLPHLSPNISILKNQELFHPTTNANDQVYQ